jgi:hypothetical protein
MTQETYDNLIEQYLNIENNLDCDNEISIIDEKISQEISETFEVINQES